MLDSKDVEMLEAILDKRITKSETAILSKMDKSLTNSENLILSELGRMQDNLEEKISNLEKNLEEMRTEVRVLKLEPDNVNLFLRIVDDLRKRIEELERKSA